MSAPFLRIGELFLPCPLLREVLSSGFRVQGSGFCVNFGAFFSELAGLLFHTFFQRLLFGNPLFRGVFADVFGGFHLPLRAEMRAEHPVCRLLHIAHVGVGHRDS